MTFIVCRGSRSYVVISIFAIAFTPFFSEFKNVNFDTIHAERSVHVNRVSLVSLANTLKNKKIKSLMPYFRGSVVPHTLEHSRTDQIKCIVSHLQPARRC
jgi:hypothetical protein